MSVDDNEPLFYLSHSSHIF